MPHLHKQKIYKALKQFFDKNKSLPEELSDQNTLTDEDCWLERDTLVGVLRNELQLDIALDNKFYHIPAKYISEYDLPLKYVAIYQSKNLFGNRAGIFYYGEIISCRCLKRKLIHEIPRDSEEYYYRFDVKEWKSLKNPIEAKEIGFVRLLTNFQMMENSTEIPQLLFKSKNVHKIYTDIKEAVLSVQTNPDITPVELHFNDCKISVELDDILLFKNDILINQFSTYDFIDLPTTIMTQIHRILKN